MGKGESAGRVPCAGQAGGGGRRDVRLVGFRGKTEGETQALYLVAREPQSILELRKGKLVKAATLKYELLVPLQGWAEGRGQKLARDCLHTHVMVST